MARTFPFFFVLLLTCLSIPGLLGAKKYSGVLEQPLALGSWLYQSKCVRCHQEYSKARLGGDYDDTEELFEAIGKEACKVQWSRQAGGILNRAELISLAAYILKWEENGEEPALPELPPLEFEKAKSIVKKKSTSIADNPGAKEADQLSPPLAHLIQTNPVAHGGYLYTRNCYRCHLTYAKGRMGKGVEVANLRRFVQEGKTSTQMKPFSMLLGGNLRNTEINAIVSYIRAFEKKGEPLAIAEELMTPPAQDPTDFLPLRLAQFKEIKGDTVAGKRIFLYSCSGCHGKIGEGVLGTSLQKVTETIRPDLYVKSIVKSGVERSLMKSWDSNNGGKLTAKDIEDVVSFVVNQPRNSRDK